MTGNVLLVRPGRWTGPALAAPAVVLLLVFAYWPVLRSAWLSVHGSDLLGRPTRFVGLDNATQLLLDGALRSALLTTVVMAVTSTALATTAAVLAALLLRRAAQRARGVVALVLSLPFAYSAAAASATFAGMLAPSSGVVDRLLAAAGTTGPGWLTEPAWAVAAVAVTTAWYEFGFAFLVMLAAVGQLDPAPLEAAALDGAGEWRTNAAIILPDLRPSILFVVVTQTISGLQIFTQVAVLTGGGPGSSTHTLVYELYQRAFGGGLPQYGIASALGLLLLVLVGVVSAVQLRLGRER